MKIAVLISGEYRKFDVCRPTMTFLDDERVDVYVSVWDSTHYVLPLIDLDVKETVDKDQILEILGRSATVLVESSSVQSTLPRIYNCPMIHRWRQGFTMIRDSGINYDYVIITRPDLYFNPTQQIDMNKFFINGDSLLSTWSHENKLGDIFMVATYEKMAEFIEALTIEKWIRLRHSDWHKFFYGFAKSIFSEIVCYYEVDHTICRYLSKPGEDHETVWRRHLDWRDISLIQKIQQYGKDYPRRAWPMEVIETAISKWESGYYDKYKNYGKDNL